MYKRLVHAPSKCQFPPAAAAAAAAVTMDNKDALVMMMTDKTCCQKLDNLTKGRNSTGSSIRSAFLTAQNFPELLYFGNCWEHNFCHPTSTGSIQKTHLVLGVKSVQKNPQKNSHKTEFNFSLLCQ